MTRITPCLYLPLSSCSPPLLCLSLSLRLAISPCPPCFLSAATGAQLTEVADGSSLGTVGVCVCAQSPCARVWLCVSLGVCLCVCTAMSLGCVIEMEMSQSATAVVCHLTLHSLHCSSSPKLTLSVCDSVFACASVSMYLCEWVSVCVGADNTWPYSLHPEGLRRWCENVISW